MGSIFSHPRWLLLLGLLCLNAFGGINDPTFGGTQSTDPNQPAPKVRPPLDIRGQADAYNTAAQVMTAYGQYLQDYSYYSDATKRKEAGANVTACLNNPNGGGCDQEKLMTALTQYNLGKQTRAMILENETNAENIKSLNPLGLNSVTEGDELPVFKFDTSGDFGKRDILRNRDREVLGEEFLKNYGSFVDELSTPEEKNYTSNTVRNDSGTALDDGQLRKDSLDGSVIAEDQSAFATDKQLEGSATVRQAVKSYKDGLTAPTITKQDGKEVAQIGGLKLDKLGFTGNENSIQNWDPKSPIVKNDSPEFYKAAALSLNSRIDAAVAKTKANASANSSNHIEEVTYHLDVKTFDSFLDDIWPPAAGPRVK